jgi:hypothetical protein
MTTPSFFFIFLALPIGHFSSFASSLVKLKGEEMSALAKHDLPEP